MIRIPGGGAAEAVRNKSQPDPGFQELPGKSWARLLFLDFSCSIPHFLVYSQTDWLILQDWPKNSWPEPQTALGSDSEMTVCEPQWSLYHRMTTSSPGLG